VVQGTQESPVVPRAAAAAGAGDPRPRRRRVLAALALAASFWWAVATTTRFGFGAAGILTSDPVVYHRLMERLFHGAVPYLTLPYEHLPLALLPMAVAELVTRLAGVPYGVAFSLLAAGLLLLLTDAIRLLGDRLGVPDAAGRWLLLAAPAFPLVLFRLEPLPTLLAVLALLAVVEGREGAGLLAGLLGIAAKGWPVLLAVPDWWRGRRRRAAVAVAFTAVLVGGLLLTPGFRQGRAFTGIHMETLVGSLLVLARLAGRGHLVLLDSAGATYVAVGTWAPALNALVGIGVALTALPVRRRPFTWPGALRLLTVLVLALLLASPLLSAQFLFWATPFAALSGSGVTRRRLGLAVGLTTLLFSFWAPTALWWAGALVGRNLLLLATAAAALGDLRADDQRASTSRRNLPV